MAVTIFLRFSTQTQANQVARAIKRDKNVAANDPYGDVFDNDGYYAPVAGGPSYYYNMDKCFGTGIVYSTFPTGTAVGADGHIYPTYTLRPGIHVNMLWTGPENVLPTQITQYRVFPVHPAVTFG